LQAKGLEVLEIVARDAVEAADSVNAIEQEAEVVNLVAAEEIVDNNRFESSEHPHSVLIDEKELSILVELSRLFPEVKKNIVKYNKTLENNQQDTYQNLKQDLAEGSSDNDNNGGTDNAFLSNVKINYNLGSLNINYDNNLKTEAPWKNLENLEKIMTYNDDITDDSTDYEESIKSFDNNKNAKSSVYKNNNDIVVDYLSSRNQYQLNKHQLESSEMENHSTLDYQVFKQKNENFVLENNLQLKDESDLGLISHKNEYLEEEKVLEGALGQEKYLENSRYLGFYTRKKLGI